MSPTTSLLILCVCYLAIMAISCTPVAILRPASSQVSESDEVDDQDANRDFVLYATNNRAERASDDWNNSDWDLNEVFRPMTYRAKRNKMSAGEIVTLLNNLARERGFEAKGRLKGMRFGVSK